ncbi:MAG: ATP-binding cassette domain-containing protein [Candidatus Scalindua rubra]|uniref:ABC transporter ATP-binding component n=1 Tax=Candidatus Scalindua brodae TaxID=237368 RepID=A0A0B0ECN1_9BACT|nr:MAG: ABC transporter ATP-binding component [Candidatus Scalindua brodae]MBZ0109124.1 ATP-binding cassette domain-containing protein [Candidatus Scalindua rubra]TWU33560.1 High-affinity branched-chain amino acid transport ATP-binding protein LivF [Candidatus Brocadiaceae bacterium S225]
MTLLKVEHINTGYGKKQTLFDVSFEMCRNETVLLVGFNGSGKSTLLKTIYGLLKPWDKEGRIWFNGENITTCKPSQLIVKGLVYIPQQNELFEDLKVKENLELSSMQSNNKKGLKSRIDNVLDHIPKLKTVLKQECKRLSGGERKLVSLATALMNQPKLIMLDEPLAGISPKDSTNIVSQLKRLKNDGVSMILVEHRLKDINSLATKVIRLELGKLYKEN